MSAPKEFPDLRSFLHQHNIDHGWLRTVLFQYLETNPQTDSDAWEDHTVWDFRNTITEFTNLLEEEPEDLDDDESDSDID